jgi:hypothetical protein
MLCWIASPVRGSCSVALINPDERRVRAFREFGPASDTRGGLPTFAAGAIYRSQTW